MLIRMRTFRKGHISISSAGTSIKRDSWLTSGDLLAGIRRASGGLGHTMETLPGTKGGSHEQANKTSRTRTTSPDAALWCSAKAGTCKREFTLTTGVLKPVPHFSHVVSSDATQCAFPRSRRKSKESDFRDDDVARWMVYFFN